MFPIRLCRPKIGRESHVSCVDFERPIERREGIEGHADSRNRSERTARQPHLLPELADHGHAVVAWSGATAR